MQKVKKITLYTTRCPKCAIIKQRLDSAGVQYNTVDNTDAMAAIGIKSVPMLRVDSKMLTFSEAIQWLKGAE